MAAIVQSNPCTDIICTETILEYQDLLIKLLSLESKKIDTYLKLLEWLDSKTEPRVKHYLSFCEHDLIAYNCFIPRKKGIYLSGGSYSSPKHRGSFIPLFDYAYEDLARNGATMVYGFSNEKSFPIAVHPYFGGIEVKAFKQIIVNPKPLLGMSIPIIGEAITELQSNEVADDYTKWRVEKPGKHYELLSWNQALAVIGLNTSNNVDVLTIQGVTDLGEYCAYLSDVFSSVWNTNPDSTISLYLSDRSIYEYLETQYEITECDYIRHLTYKAFVPSSWDLSRIEMIDSDVF